MVQDPFSTLSISGCRRAFGEIETPLWNSTIYKEQTSQIWYQVMGASG